MHCTNTGEEQKTMASVSLSKIVEKMKLEPITPEIEIKGI